MLTLTSWELSGHFQSEVTLCPPRVSRGSNLSTPLTVITVFFIIFVQIGAFWFGFCISLITDVDHLFMCLSSVYFRRNVFVHHLPVSKLGYIFYCWVVMNHWYLIRLRWKMLKNVLASRTKFCTLPCLFSHSWEPMMRLDDNHSFQVINKTVKWLFQRLFRWVFTGVGVIFFNF